MRKQNFTWVIIILLLATLACGLFGGDGDEAALKADISAPTATQAPAEETVVEDVETVKEEAPESAEETVEFTATAGLDAFSSYRLSFIQDFDGVGSDGKPSVGRNEALLEVTTEPKIIRLEVKAEGPIVEEYGGTTLSDVYHMDNGTSYYYASAAGDTWTVAPTYDDGETFNQGFYAPQNYISLPQTARCNSESEIINGISTRRCRFSEENNIVDDKYTYESATGSVWVAVDGNYIVKYEVEGEIQRLPTAQAPGVFESGAIILKYELLEANSDFTISLPQEAIDAAASTGAEATGGVDTGDLPVLEDAENITAVAGFMNYSTSSDIPGVVDFYRQELPAIGWQENTDQAYIDDNTATLNFQKDGQTLILIVTKEDNLTSVVVTTQ